MGVLLTLIAGLVIWVVLWAIGAKSFDAFLITSLMLVIALRCGFWCRTCPETAVGRTCGHRRGRRVRQPRTEGFAKIAQSAVLPLTLLPGRKGRA